MKYDIIHIVIYTQRYSQPSANKFLLFMPKYCCTSNPALQCIKFINQRMSTTTRLIEEIIAQRGICIWDFYTDRRLIQNKENNL